MKVTIDGRTIEICIDRCVGCGSLRIVTHGHTAHECEEYIRLLALGLDDRPLTYEHKLRVLVGWESGR